MKYIIAMLMCLLMVSCSTVTNSTGTSTGSTVATSQWTEYGITGLGVVAGGAMVNYINEDNAQVCIQTICSALLTTLTGTIPTVDQMTAVATAFKSDTATLKYTSTAGQFIQQLQTLIDKWKAEGAADSVVTQRITWFIYGVQLGSNFKVK